MDSGSIDRSSILRGGTKKTDRLISLFLFL